MKRLFEKKILKRPNKYSRDFYVEVIDRETIRIQLRNVSLWFNDSDFIELVEGLSEALKKLTEIRIEQMKEYKVLSIPISDIEYCDEGHAETPDKKHREAIEIVKQLIATGNEITPILVKEQKTDKHKYKRLDGYSRLKAFQELGYSEIRCYVDNTAPFGGQTGVPWIFYKWFGLYKT